MVDGVSCRMRDEYMRCAHFRGGGRVGGGGDAHAEQQHSVCVGTCTPDLLPRNTVASWLNEPE